MASEEDLGAFFKRLQEKRSIELTEEDRGYIQDHLYNMDLDLRRIGEAINQKYPLIGSQCHAQAEEVSK